MKILGIETSCDDTGIAIYDSNDGFLINQLYHQSDLHNFNGGIIPELAARMHMKSMVQFLDEIFKKKNIMSDIDLIAYTAGPGLTGSLLVGATFACSLGFFLNIPVLPVNHMEAHLLSPMVYLNSIPFPFIGLLVSGKHTQLVYAEKLGQYKLLGDSLDDAAGEAFDKTAKLLGLKYPGGPSISKLAQMSINNKLYFPRPMIYHSNLNFSFSGLKTFTANIIKKSNPSIEEKANIAQAFEDSVIDILLIKSKKALKNTGLNRLVISGGVSANILLRKKSKIMMKNYFNGEVFFADSTLCTDNGAMIAYLGFLHRKKVKNTNLEIIIKPKWSIHNIF
ncbi:tRNA (adenosine(37)-N6)-threonylcarbamoyltransferase complex transferase subunit TsaD [Buchnera aphidicola]|uniref:tRNA (adenosine(37)-N6)-threonylcarbamoyltransferase complex transferase subunit TsaD n=1 Tax=Buchnera aphidicola TaxID=9 RepID=UPI003BEF2226